MCAVGADRFETMMRRIQAREANDHSAAAISARELLQLGDVGLVAVAVAGEALAGVARDDVEVQVEDGLAGVFAVELGDGDAVGLQHLHRGVRQAVHVLHQRRDFVSPAIPGNCAPSRSSARPADAARLRKDIHEGEHLVVLIDLHRRNLAAQNFGEQVVVVVGSVRLMGCLPALRRRRLDVAHHLQQRLARDVFHQAAWNALRPPVTMTRWLRFHAS